MGEKRKSRDLKPEKDLMCCRWFPDGRDPMASLSGGVRATALREKWDPQWQAARKWGLSLTTTRKSILPKPK